MKAALIEAPGLVPRYLDFPDPQAADGEHRIQVLAAAMSQVVKGRAAGRHYSYPAGFPGVAGIDGIGQLENGQRVYFAVPNPPYGSMAEIAVAPTALCVPVPEELDSITAAALANPGQSSWAALTERARLRPGETVLINGATSTSGRLAVRIARHLGAGKIIATGRNRDTLAELEQLGADQVIQLTEDNDAFELQLMQPLSEGVDIVLDYLWGTSAERILVAAVKAAADAVPIRYIQIGSISGADITLPSAVLRASAIELMGSGIGSIPMSRFMAATANLMQAAIPANLTIATTPVPLADVERAWPLDDSRRRTVFTIGA
jgi:NADPH:quinone reductase-like Zn-dependent oxidoreductase